VAGSAEAAVAARNLEIVRRTDDAWRADLDVVFSVMDPRMEFENRTEVPDLEGTYVGREAIADHDPQHPQGVR
jgi:hypothetical protein